jgi:hypothetical protein
MGKRLRSNTMQRLCQTQESTEVETPGGGSFVYGPCKKHDFFMALIHAPISDVRLIAESLLEAVQHAEAVADKGTKPTQEADK